MNKLESLLITIALMAIIVAMALTTGCESITINALSGNSILTTRSQGAAGAEAIAEGMAEGGGQTEVKATP